MATCHRGVLIPVPLALLLGAWAEPRGVRLLARGVRHSEDPDAPYGSSMAFEK
jgi:hypothetical protein